MKNLLYETLDVLKKYDKSPKDVKFVKTSKKSATWENFAKVANFEYDDSYPYDEDKINPTLKIVGDNWWLTRHRYNGHEWWEIRQMPRRPPGLLILDKEDIFI